LGCGSKRLVLFSHLVPPPEGPTSRGFLNKPQQPVPKCCFECQGHSLLYPAHYTGIFLGFPQDTWFSGSGKTWKCAPLASVRQRMRLTKSDLTQSDLTQSTHTTFTLSQKPPKTDSQRTKLHHSSSPSAPPTHISLRI
jgi:hypothetical protein